MYNQTESSTIQCKIHQDNFTAMSVIKQKINHGTTLDIKVKYAEELSDKVNSLINCSQYDDQRQDCKYCHTIAYLHKKTAELIIKAKSLL